VRLWDKLRVEHYWLCLLRAPDRGGDPRSVRWLMAIGRLINVLFVDTLLAALYWNDDGTCEAYTDAAHCLIARNLVSLDSQRCLIVSSS
jgi:hypothetical protein